MSFYAAPFTSEREIGRRRTVTYASVLVSLAVIAAPGPKPLPWVLVPEPLGPNCIRATPVTTQIELTPGLITTRTSSSGVNLTRLQYSLGADFAVEVRRPHVPSDFRRIEVLIHGRDKLYTGAGITASEALEAAWPDQLPPLSTALGIPNAASLAATCDGQLAEAETLAGAALSPLLLTIANFDGPSPPANMFKRWARASSDINQGELKKGLKELQAVISALEQGFWAPAWRRLPETSSTSPSAITLGREGVYAFEDGILTYLDLRNGHARWRRQFGRIAPKPSLFKDGDPVLVINDEGIRALSSDFGKLVWEVELAEAHEEVAIRGQRLVLGGKYEILAVDRMTGRELWVHELEVASIAGPIDLGSSIAVPLVTGLRTLNAKTGRKLRDIKTADEISAPALPTRKGFIWLFVGSDHIQQVDPRRGTVRGRFNELPGVIWPPVVVGERLAVLSQTRKRRTRLRLLDITNPRKLRKSVRAQAPIAQRSDFKGFLHLDRRKIQIVERDRNFNVTSKYTLPGRASTLATYGQQAAVGVDQELLFIDITHPKRRRRRRKKRNRLIRNVPFEAPIAQVVMNRHGGVALLENGILYGWPGAGDPRQQAWLRLARRQAAQTALDAGLFVEARNLAQSAVSRAPDDVRAVEILAEAELQTDRSPAVSRFLNLHTRTATGTLIHQKMEARLLDIGLAYIPPKPPILLDPNPSSLTSTTHPSLQTQLSTRSVQKSDLEQKPKAINQPPPLPPLGFAVNLTLNLPKYRIAAGGENVVALKRRGRKPIWKLKFRREEITRLEIDNTTLLVWSKRRLRRLSLKTGRQQDILRLRRRIKHYAHPDGSLLAALYDGKALKIIDLRTASRLRKIPIPDVVSLNTDNAYVHMELADGRIWRLNLETLSQNYSKR